AIILLDQAGWHGAKALVVPNNISLVPLPPRAPELNGQENIWQFMRQNWLSNRIFKSFDDIVDHCCYAWNTLIDQPWKLCPSRDATGQQSVTQSEDWYKLRRRVKSLRPIAGMQAKPLSLRHVYHPSRCARGL